MKRITAILLTALMLVALASFPLNSSATDAGEFPFAEFPWYICHDPCPDNDIVNDALNEYLLPLINAKVTLVFNAATYADTVSVKVNSGEDTGLVCYPPLGYPQAAANGAFYPMNDLLDKYAPQTKALFPEGVWNCMTIGGNIYGVPTKKDNAYFISMLYDKKLLDSLGMTKDDIPYTLFRGLEATFDKVLEKRNEVYGERPEPISWATQLEMPYMFAVENFMGWDNQCVVCNIPGIMDIAGYEPEEAFNLYGTAEYRAEMLERARGAAKGHYVGDINDYQTKADYQNSGYVLCHPGWGYVIPPVGMFGENVQIDMLGPKLIWADTGNFYSAGVAISSQTKTPEQIMMFIELINNDPFVSRMLRFGVEGTHWTRDAEGKMTFAGTKNEDPLARAYYYWYGSMLGNLTILEAPEELAGPDGLMFKKIDEFNSKASLARHMGFVLNTIPIENEIAACSAVVAEYKDELRYNMLPESEVDARIDEFNAKLEANGLQKILDEVNSQLAEWRAAND